QESQTAMSSSQLATALALEPIQVRQDLESIGVTGQPRVGFPVAELIQAIERFLGWDNVTDAFIIGAGHLGTALAGYRGFESKGLNVVALFDNDPGKIGQTIHGKEVLPIDKLGNLASRLHVHIAILAVPAEAAANVAQLAIDAGIQAIWNFTPTKLIVPENVILERVDLAASLAVLSSKLAARLRPAGAIAQAQEVQA
ncbi:MAG: redox-sensing transcriptional repressor Rex, partial [Phycisphaerales bacterium]